MALPAEALPQLCAARRPYLIGVRHHSVALSAALPALLESADPDAIFIELPASLQPWLPHLAHPAAEAPLALALASRQGEQLGFYPFADFSPELVAARWARARGLPLYAFDLDPQARPTREHADRGGAPGLIDHLRAQTEEEPWEAQVEGPGAGGDPEALRAAALLFGYALRWEAAHGGGVDRVDLAREAAMRAALKASTAQRPAVVVGAFHAAALLPDPLLWQDPGPSLAPPAEPPVAALLPYPFALLDARSGYPAGITDPAWRQRALQALIAGRPLQELPAAFAVALCRRLRAAGHVASAADAAEVARLCADLATLRGLPAAGRREFLEAVGAALGQGEPMGRGLVLAQALEAELIGEGRGRLAPGTPQSGLHPHVTELLTALRLPGPESGAAKEPVERSLDPLRSPLDRRRQVAMERLNLCHVPYAERRASTVKAETLTQTWLCRWTPATDALIEVAALGGSTLEAAATGALLREEALARGTEGWSPADALQQLILAGEAGLGALVARQLDLLCGPLLAEASAAQLTALLDWLAKVERGQVAGLPAEAAPGVGGVAAFALPVGLDRPAIAAALFAALQGLAGSEEPDDARTLADTAQLCLREPGLVADGRLWHLLGELAETGSPRIAAAALGARYRLRGDLAVAERLASAVDGSGPADAILGGGLVALGASFEADPALHGPLLDRVLAQDDEAFLARLPDLRGAFADRPEAWRRELFALAAARGGWSGHDPQAPAPAHRLAQQAQADRAGRQALHDLGLPLDSAAIGEAARPSSPPPLPTRGLAPADRWRLILGIDRAALPPEGRRYARSLDELYGQGAAPSLFGGGGGAGLEPPFPTVRAWAEELGALFGARVREEVLGEAALTGRGAALLELDPEQVTPSVALLTEVLGLRGAVPEARMAPMRRLIERVVAALVEALAVRVRPALTGLSTPTPTRRPNGRLDLGRTLRANLHTARPTEAGMAISPERFLFRSRARKSLDWRLFLVVDTSGSMEASVVYAALMAAILHALPALSVSFYAFSTEVIDHSGLVDDPLALLLGVEVGGGTRIAKAMAYTRSQITVPSRSLVVLITDFEEGDPPHRLPAELRAMAEAGVTLLGLAALDEQARPRYDTAMAAKVAAAGMPVAALSPLELARWVGEKLRGAQ